ncbi:hypothetical protein FACS1894159_03570 [Bacteroidia bacterium]|nr:hypothetical protein FACS1894159_03570 [Bacteroidia bacterium]
MMLLDPLFYELTRFNRVLSDMPYPTHYAAGQMGLILFFNIATMFDSILDYDNLWLFGIIFSVIIVLVFNEKCMIRLEKNMPMIPLLARQQEYGWLSYM